MTFHQGGSYPSYKTKKALRDGIAAGHEVRLYSTSMFGGFDGHHSELPEGDTFNVVGPDPYTKRNWYASVTRKGGKTIVKSESIGDFIKAKKPKLGSGKRFAQLSGKLSKEGVRDPKALAAFIGRKKYGEKKFGKLSAHKKSLFGMARFEKAVVAGTRPFARRALPKEQVKQVRAKAPRYGVMKAMEQKGEKSGRVLSGPNCELCKIRGRSHPVGYVHREIREQTIKKSCDNCGVRPVSGGLPLCVTCADPIQKARKRKPDMVDHIMRMESGEASDDEGRHAMQQMVNSGQAWKMQGSYGRAAMGMIENGQIALGHQGHRDYYGNYLPSRHEVQEGTKGHASFVRAAGFEPDKCGKDCPSPEVPDQLPQSIRGKNVNKAFARFPLGPLSKTYVRVDAARAEGFLKGRVNPEMPRDYSTGSTPRFSPDATRANAPEMEHVRSASELRRYPSSQCPTCGTHGNALEIMRHMQVAGHIDDDKGMNAHTKIGQSSTPGGHTSWGTLKSMRKGFEFSVLDENDPEYHGHTGGGAGYAGKKWVHQHGPVPGIVPLHAKEDHRHFKMGAWTTDHSPSGYQEEILGHSDAGLDDPACSLPNCRHPLSQHIPTDDGPMGCKDCNNTRPRRNVRHEFRA